MSRLPQFLLFSVLMAVAFFSGCEKTEQTTVEELAYRISDSLSEFTGVENGFFGAVSVTWHAGELYISDGMQHRLIRCRGDFSHPRFFGRKGKGPGEFELPGLVRVYGERLYVEDRQNQRIQVLTLEGEYRYDIPVSGIPDIEFAIDSRGQLYVVDPDLTANTLITCYDSLGNKLRTLGTVAISAEEVNQEIAHLHNGASLDLDDQNNLYVGFRSSKIPLLRKYNAQGELLWETHLSEVPVFQSGLSKLNKALETSPDGQALFIYFYIMALDYFQGRVYLATSEHNADLFGFDAATGTFTAHIRLDRKAGHTVQRIAFTPEGALYLAGYPSVFRALPVKLP